MEPEADAERVGAVDGLGEQERPARQPFRVDHPLRGGRRSPRSPSRPRGRSPPSVPIRRAATLGPRGPALGLRLEGGGGREVDPAHPVDVGQLDLDLLPLLDHVVGGLDVLRREHRDVDEAFLAGQDLDERAEVHDPLHRALVDPADLGLLDHARDDALGDLGAFLVRAVDGDGAVVLDVDLGAGLLADRLDVLAARPDDEPDLVHGDLDRDDLRRERGNLGARLAGWSSFMTERMCRRPLRACSRALVMISGVTPLILMSICRAVMPVSVPGDLEVHVAEVILLAEDVGQHDEPLAFLHQSHRDARDGLRHRDARVEQAEGAAAHAWPWTRSRWTRGSRETTRMVYGNDSFVGQHLLEGALGEVAVADLAAPGSAHAPRLADRERREVVVQHEALAGVAVDVVEDLLVERRAEGRDDQGLGLAPGEQRRAVGAGQQVDLAGDVADVLGAAAVGAHASAR